MRRPSLTFAIAPALLTLAVTAPPAQSRAGLDAAAAPCHYERERTIERRLRMSDLNAWKGVSATFRYAADHAADTYVGVAVQSPGGNWTAQGTDHVTNATVFGQSVAMRGRGDRPVTGIFSFNVFKETGRGCDDNGPKRYTRAYRFEGGMRAERGHDAPKGLTGRCDTAAGHRKLARNASAFTGTVQSFTYDRSFTLFGLTLGSSTTLSSNAQIELTNHSKHAVWICGVSASGQPVAIADAAMLYAGPRWVGGTR